MYLVCSACSEIAVVHIGASWDLSAEFFHQKLVENFNYNTNFIVNRRITKSAMNPINELTLLGEDRIAIVPRCFT